MASPNFITANAMLGKTTGVILSNTSSLLVLNNPANSLKTLKINTLNVSNYGPNSAIVSVYFDTLASLGGIDYNIASNISIPASGTLNIIDKTSQYYLEENTSLGARASIANTFVVTVSYEELS